MYLSSFNIKKAFFISPLVNMKEVIEGMMKQYGISLDTLKTRKIIDLDNGQTLSYDFYESLKEKDSWDIKTYVLYGEKDKIVDQESIFNFISNHNSSLTIMKNGKHYFHTPGQLKFIKKWINEYLS